MWARQIVEDAELLLEVIDGDCRLRFESDHDFGVEATREHLVLPDGYALLIGFRHHLKDTDKTRHTC
jgi:hypothetical protein